MSHASELLVAAQNATGLEDFGDDSFREGLERLVRSIDNEADFNAAGEQLMRERIVGHLSQRLQIEDWYRRHPDIDDEPIVEPLIVLGLPRTGSTALSYLLAEDSNTRCLRYWESLSPCPPPSTVTGHDPRLDAAQQMQDMQRGISPRFASMVPLSATGPAECQDLMALDFKAHYFMAYGHIPSYADWFLNDADLTRTYLYERRALKLLQWGSPTRPWRLKCPNHILFLPAIAEAFPDARFVMTHRDPTEVVVSLCDLIRETGGQLNNSFDPDWIGTWNSEWVRVGVQRTLEFRDAGADSRFYDIDFRAVQRDPIGEVRRLYEWLGEPVTEEFEGGMRTWWKEHAESRDRIEHPDPAEFGLDLEDIRASFSDYLARVSVGNAH